jgi:alkylhydroperoxidase family enzyme
LAHHHRAKGHSLYAAVKGALGMVPSLILRVLGSPSSLLQGCRNVSLNGALGGGVLPAAVRERLALLVAERDGCDYCLLSPAHSL